VGRDSKIRIPAYILRENRTNVRFWAVLFEGIVVYYKVTKMYESYKKFGSTENFV